MSDLKTRSMQFLYRWVTKGHLSNLRKGMVEELEAFVAEEQSLAQAQATAARIEATKSQESSIVDSVSKEFDKESQ